MKWSTKSNFKSVLAATSLAVSIASPVSAQSLLQNTNSGLQPQSTPSQNTINTQNQAGNTQTNNSSSLLNQNVSQPLGVVSSPRQTNPDAVVQPGGTQASSSTNDDGVNVGLIAISVLFFLAAITGLYFLGKSSEITTKPVAAKPEVKPEPLPVKSKKARKQQQGRKKKKSARKK